MIELYFTAPVLHPPGAQRGCQLAGRLCTGGNVRVAHPVPILAGPEARVGRVRDILAYLRAPAVAEGIRKAIRRRR